MLKIEKLPCLASGLTNHGICYYCKLLLLSSVLVFLNFNKTANIMEKTASSLTKPVSAKLENAKS